MLVVDQYKLPVNILHNKYPIVRYNSTNRNHIKHNNYNYRQIIRVFRFKYGECKHLKLNLQTCDFNKHFIHYIQ